MYSTISYKELLAEMQQYGSINTVLYIAFDILQYIAVLQYLTSCQTCKIAKNYTEYSWL